MKTYNGINTIMFLIALTFPLHNAFAAPKKNVIKVNAEQVIQLAWTHLDLVILDVRLKMDYSRAHIPDAVNLPSREVTLETLSAFIINKATPTVIYCNGGGCDRSRQAASIAASLGYSNLYWFQDGMNNWLEQRYAIERISEAEETRELLAMN